MGTPILHVQARTTEWQQCAGPMSALSAGTIWWRWYAGAPQLQLRGAEWAGPRVIPWSELAPAPPVTSSFDRFVREIMQTNDLSKGSVVAMWVGGIFLRGATTAPVQGTLTYSL